MGAWRPATLLALIVPTSVAAQAAQTGKLEYTPKVGAVLGYAVKVEADGKDAVETLTGSAIYTVKSTTDGLSLAFSGSATPTRKAKHEGAAAGSGMARFGLFRFAPDGVTLTLSPAGRVLRFGGDGALPGMLGDLSRFVFEPLSPGGKPAWESARDVSLVVAAPPSRTAAATAPQPVTHLARETVSYTLGEKTGDVQVIEKQYRLATEETVGGEPRILIAGKGRILFDTKLGAPVESELKATLTENGANTTERTFLTISVKRQDGLVAAKPVYRLQSIAHSGAKPLSTDEIEVAMIELRSPDKFKRKGAADKLEAALPDIDVTKVARAIEGVLNDDDLFVRWAAVKALGVWADPDSVPKLIGKLSDSEHAVRWATLEVLGGLQDPRACMPLAEMIAYGKDRDFAGNALKKIPGAATEEAAIKLLTADAWEARTKACEILQEHGTRKASSALALHARRDENGIVRMAAQKALQMVDRR